MKKWFFIILTLLIVKTATAQNGATVFGVLAGYNYSWLTGKDLSTLSNGGNAKGGSGFQVGATVHSQWGKYWGLQHEVLLVQQTATLKVAGSQPPVFNSRFRSWYIDLYPVSATFYAGGLQLFVGPYVGVLIDASMQQMDSLGNIYTNRKIFGTADQLGNYRQKMDAGVVGGIGYTFKGGWSINARYVRGFVPVLEDSGELIQQKIFNEKALLSIGYLFGERMASRRGR
jgi:hypothetical protein